MNVVERRVPQITAASELPPTIHVAGSNVVLGRKRRWHFVLQGELGCRIPRGHSLLRGGAEYLDLRLAVRLARNSSVAVGAVLVDMRGPVKHVGSEDAEGCRQAADTSYYAINLLVMVIQRLPLALEAPKNDALTVLQDLLPGLPSFPFCADRKDSRSYRADPLAGEEE